MELTQFEYDTMNFSRIIDEDDRAWFNADEIAAYLEYSRTRDMLRMVSKDEQKCFPLPKEEAHEVRGSIYHVPVWIPEVVLYELLFASNKPAAKQFSRFVADTLVQLRSGKHPLQQQVSDLQATVCHQANLLRLHASTIRENGEMRATEFYSKLLQRPVSASEATQMSKILGMCGTSKSGNYYKQGDMAPDLDVVSRLYESGFMTDSQFRAYLQRVKGDLV